MFIPTNVKHKDVLSLRLRVLKIVGHLMLK